MKKKIDLTTQNIENYTNMCKNYLSSCISDKRYYLGLATYYSREYDLINNELRGILIVIENVINEINKLNKRIALLEHDKVILGYNSNVQLGNADVIINKVNDDRYNYNKIVDELNKLTRYRDELRENLKDNKDRKNVLVSEKKKYNRKLNKNRNNIKICEYNIDNSYKVLSRLDNIYLIKIDKVSESYITPKVKRIK